MIMEIQQRRKWKKRIKVAFIVYAVVGIILFFLQDRLLLRPTQLAQNFRYDFKQPFREFNIPINSKSNLNLIQFAGADTVKRGVVLYFHGNRDNVARYAAQASDLTKHGYDVWMMDYPGFGKSTGPCSEKILYEWAMQVYKLARSRFPADHITLYGRSLGTGIATQLASVRDCKQVILETPYYSISSLAKRYFFIYPVDWFIHYKIPSWQYLAKIDAPVIIFHGTDDGVIPYSNASRLKKFLKPGDEFITLKNAGHNNCGQFSEMIKKLDSVLLR
jgi:pimeloyl-ACP methyl ester carboxylesterase